MTEGQRVRRDTLGEVTVSQKEDRQSYLPAIVLVAIPEDGDREFPVRRAITPPWPSAPEVSA
jgi:hypothetical protein